MSRAVPELIHGGHQSSQRPARAVEHRAHRRIHFVTYLKEPGMSLEPPEVMTVRLGGVDGWPSGHVTRGCIDLESATIGYLSRLLPTEAFSRLSSFEAVYPAALRSARRDRHPPAATPFLATPGAWSSAIRRGIQRRQEMHPVRNDQHRIRPLPLTTACHLQHQRQIHLSTRLALMPNHHDRCLHSPKDSASEVAQGQRPQEEMKRVPSQALHRA